MDARTYLNKQLPMLGRARLLSRFFFAVAGLLVVASFVLPPLQKAAIQPTGEMISNWEYYLLQLPWLNKDTLLTFYISALVLVWMGYMLRALVTIAEIQCVDLDER